MDYVPTKDAVFLTWVKSLLLYVQAHFTEFNIQSAFFQPLLDLNTAWEAAYAKVLDPNKGAVDVAEKNRVRKAIEKAVREFVKVFLAYSPFVSDNDRNEMQIPVHNTKPTSVHSPMAFPEYRVDTSVQSRLTVGFCNSATKHRGKPTGVHGAEIRWETWDDAPAKAEDLGNSDFITRIPYIFEFTGDMQGKWVYFCPRWENNKGEKGAWGAIRSVVIP